MIINFNQSSTGYSSILNNLNIPNASFCNMKNLVNYCFAGMANKAEGSFNCLKYNVKAIKNTVHLSDRHQVYLKHTLKIAAATATCFGAYYAYNIYGSQIPEQDSDSTEIHSLPVIGAHLIASNANALIESFPNKILLNFLGSNTAGFSSAIQGKRFLPVASYETSNKAAFTNTTHSENLNVIAWTAGITFIPVIAGIFLNIFFNKKNKVEVLEEASVLVKEQKALEAREKVRNKLEKQLVNNLNYETPNLPALASIVLTNVSGALNLFFKSDLTKKSQLVSYIEAAKLLSEVCSEQSNKSVNDATKSLAKAIELLAQAQPQREMNETETKIHSCLPKLKTMIISTSASANDILEVINLLLSNLREFTESETHRLKYECQKAIGLALDYYREYRMEDARKLIKYALDHMESLEEYKILDLNDLKSKVQDLSSALNFPTADCDSKAILEKFTNILMS